MEEKKVSLYYLILVDGISKFNLSQSDDIIPNAAMVVMVMFSIFLVICDVGRGPNQRSKFKINSANIPHTH